MIARFGQAINHPDSVYYWAWKNNVPVFCPAITDGSIGDMLFFHSYKNPGLVVDVVGDIRAINDSAMRAAPRRTGMIILGGGEGGSLNESSHRKLHWQPMQYAMACASAGFKATSASAALLRERPLTVQQFMLSSIRLEVGNSALAGKRHPLLWLASCATIGRLQRGLRGVSDDGGCLLLLLLPIIRCTQASYKQRQLDAQWSRLCCLPEHSSGV